MTELEIAAKNVKEKFDIANIKTGIPYKEVAKMLNVSPQQLSRALTWNTSTRYSNSKGGSTYLRY